MHFRVYCRVLILFTTFSYDQAYNFSSNIDKCQTRSCYPATGNLLIGRERQLKATSTCGLKYPEPYCIVSHLEDRKKCFRCDSRHPWMRHINEKSHRVQNVISDDMNMRMKKWWQSENGFQNVSVQLDLEAEFHFTHLIMTFKSFRPAAMLVERSSDYGKTWKVYRYFAYDCAESFAGILEASVPQQHGDIICDSRYSKVEPSTNGEVVLKVLSPHIRTYDPFAPEIQDLLRVTNLRINFTKLHTLGDNLLDNRPEISEKYYYAIYDMIVRGSCSCYGHAEHCIPFEGDGVSFVTNTRADMVHGRCQCTHHTKGMNCKECEDFYNDVPWRPAVDREINACKPCQCNGHATRCHFDKSVYEASGFVSGGVCDDCQHNTMGKNCEQCKPYFYREPGRQIDDPHGCQPCECDLRGSLNQGICDSETDSAHNLVAGTCHCKANVDGDRCDRCKNGFWNMNQDNEVGCAACTCFLLGTYGNEGCNKQTGQCTCKRLVTGENCDKCLPEHYGLSDDIEGCKACNCDLGGAIDNQCDVTNGQCKCRPHFTGRRCDSPESGFYCVDLDHYTFEAESAQLVVGATVEQRESAPADRSRQTWSGLGFVKLRENGVIEFTIENINVAMKYNFIVRFESHLSDTWQNVVITLIRPDLPRADGPCRDAVPKDDFMRAVLYPGGRYYEVQETVCLEPGVQYRVKLSLGLYQNGIPDKSASVLIDSLVLLPATSSLGVFNDGSPLAERRLQEFEHYQCRFAFLDLASRYRLNQEPCQQFVCPLAASLLDTGVECLCDLTGSVSGICSPKGGQCQCKSNVVGRRCERCSTGTFGFGPQGCSACECNSVGSLDNFCDLRTGQCKCREGVYGRQCDQCQPGYWGFPNCRPCQCNGHADICDQESGACIDCRDLTTSYSCERCQDGYYGDPRIGGNIACRPCPCPGGPGSGFQHADTCYLDPPTQNVVCNCKPGYVGERCDQCAVNYWGNPTEIGGSCERCDCNSNIDFSVADSCDKLTGRCLKCLHFTEGFQCEHCIAGYFGDAKIQQCQKCVCNVLGTNQAAGACDRETGQCPCLPNVQGLRCDACAPNHWKIASATGCEPCDCDPLGVVMNSDQLVTGMQCNEFDGQCACKVGRGGRTCSECQDYFWGDPKVECKRCECNPEGSLTLQCHRENGTCICQPGSGGPRCDQCARGYTGTWPQCYPCGECFQNWDETLSGLKDETDKIIEKASNIETTGVASVYDKEFQEMDQKLTTVQAALNNVNKTRHEIELLSIRSKDAEKSNEDIKSRLNDVENKTMDTSNSLEGYVVRQKNLRSALSELQNVSIEFEANATKLRQSDVEGAYNVTREALASAREAQHRIQSTNGLSQDADALRLRTAEKLSTFEPEFNKQYQENQETLDDLEIKLRSLHSKMPQLNDAVCGAPGDPCNELCGGAKCGKCGGPSCGDGAVTKSEQAYRYSKEANEKLEEKQRESNILMQDVRNAVSATEKANLDARAAFETATRVAQLANATKQMLRSKLERLASALNSEAATFADVRHKAQEILNMTVESINNQEVIEVKARRIADNLAKLTNIDAIITETRNNLTIATGLKDNADTAKTNAVEMLNTTLEVIETLNRTKVSQEKTKMTIEQTNGTITTARDKLNQISNKTDSVEKSVNDATQQLNSLKTEMNKVDIEYLQIDKDVDTADSLSQSAKATADSARQRLAALEEAYKKAQTTMNEKLGYANSSTGGGDGDQGSAKKEKAERLRQRATAILERNKNRIAQFNELNAKVKRNELLFANLVEKNAKLQKELNEYTARIQMLVDHHEKCS